jgi:hypothetical protein
MQEPWSPWIRVPNRRERIQVDFQPKKIEYNLLVLCDDEFDTDNTVSISESNRYFSAATRVTDRIAVDVVMFRVDVTD